MEKFLSALCSLRIAQQGTSIHSLQKSLVGELSQFQVLQQQKSLSSDGCHHMCLMLLIVHGGAVQKSTRDGTKHGGPPPHGASPPAQGFTPSLMTGI